MRTGVAGVCVAVLLACGSAAASDVSVEGFVDGLAVANTGSGPMQRPQAMGLVSFESKLRRDLIAHLTLRGRVGGPFVGGSGVGFYGLDHMFQNVSPAFEALEGWLEWRGRAAEVRAGMLRVAWGKLDGAPPTDVVNPRGYHDPLVEDSEERKFGVPMLQGSWFPGDVPALGLEQLQLSLVYVPVAVPPRMALIRERWFPSSTDPPPRFEIPKRLIPAEVVEKYHLQLDGPLVIEPVTFDTQNDVPPRTLGDGGVGLRLGGRWRRLDWAAYHYTGAETSPVMTLPVEVILVDPPPDLALRATSYLRQQYARMHMTGGDVATALGPVTLRAEAATFVDRPYARLAGPLFSTQALAALPLTALFDQIAARGRTAVPLGNLFVKRSSVEWGVGADTVWRGFMPLVQLNQIVLFGSAPRLLIGQPDTRLTARVARRLLDDRFEVEMRGVYAFEQGAWFLFPRVEYLLRDDLAVDVGYLAIGGSRNTLLGQYKDNDEVVLHARWSF